MQKVVFGLERFPLWRYVSGEYSCNNSGSWEGEGECNRSIHLSAFRGKNVMIKSTVRWPIPLGVT